MKWCNISRRHFLQGLGKSALALPFLPSLLPSAAKAQGIEPPKRFIAMRGLHGSVLMENYLPVSQGLSEYIVPNISYDSGPHRMRYGSLSAQAARNGGQISATIPAALTPWLDKMFFWHGFDMPRDLGHFRGQTLGNMGAPANTDLSEVQQSPTIDEVIAYSPSFYGNSSYRRRCLALSTTRSNGGSLCFGYTDPTTRSGDIVLRSLISSPLDLFNELFDSGSTDGTQSNTTLVDQVYVDYQSLRNNQRIGTQDRQRLEAHLSRLQELQNRMTAFSGECADVTPPGEFASMNELDASAQAQFYHIYNRVIVAAIACDSCRIFSLSTPVANGSGSGDAQDTTTWHGWSHAFPEHQPELIAQNAWINEHIFLDLVQQLDAVDEGNGTALDNSLVMRTDAHSFTVHCVTNLYALCAGGLGGYFKTDRYIDFRDQNIVDSGLIAGNKPGFLYNQFLANILLAMGVPRHDFESYNRPGQKGYGDHTFLLREGAGGNKDIARRDRYLSHMDKLSDVLPLVRG